MKHVLSCQKAFAWRIYVASSLHKVGEEKCGTENRIVTLYRTSFDEKRFSFKEMESFRVRCSGFGGFFLVRWDWVLRTVAK